MAQVISVKIVEAHFQGKQLSGQVTVGKFILKIGGVHDGVINLVWPEQQPLSDFYTLPDHLLGEVDSVLQTLKRAAEVGRWQEVLPLIWTVESALIMSGQWDTWLQILHWGEQAARETGNRAATARILHQIGTRALCLEDTLAALKYLSQALRIRETLGDQAGATVTRHNLNLLSKRPIPPRQSGQTRTISASKGRSVVASVEFLLTVIVAFLFVFILGLGGWLAWQYWSETSSSALASVGGAAIPTSTEIATPLPTFTPTAIAMLLETQPPTHTPLPTPTDVSTFLPTPTNMPAIPIPTFTPMPTLTETPTPPKPSASLTPNTLNFGVQVLAATSSAQAVTLLNDGLAPLTISSATLGGANGGDFSLLSDGCTGLSLAPGMSCTISISFAPVAEGNRNASLVIATNAADSPLSVLLSGSGTAAPKLELSSTSLDFGLLEVGTTAPAQVVTVVNSGSGNLNIGYIELAGANPNDFQITGENCSGATLPGGGSCTINFIFNPTTAGNRSAELTVVSQTVGSQSVWLSGIGEEALPGLKSEIFFHGGGGYYCPEGQCGGGGQVSIVPANTNDSLGDSLDHIYSAGEQILIIGTGFEPNTNLPLGIYYITKLDTLTAKGSLVYSQVVTTDSQGNFQTSIGISPSDYTGSYAVVPADDTEVFGGGHFEVR